MKSEEKDQFEDGLEEESWYKEEVSNPNTRDQEKRGTLYIPPRNKLRTLRQYKDLTDEEFEIMYEEKLVGIQRNRAFEKVIQRKITDISKDYEVDDLNSNDHMTLRALAQAMIDLEALELENHKMKREGLDMTNINLLDRMSRMRSDLRADISKMQTDLNISRRVRKQDTNTSVKDQFEDLKKKAKEFYQQKMSYVFCPECKMLLATIWTLYPNEEKNKLTFVCNRALEDGSKCGHKFTVTTKELMEKRGTNNEDIPESLR